VHAIPEARRPNPRGERCLAPTREMERPGGVVRLALYLWRTCAAHVRDGLGGQAHRRRWRSRGRSGAPCTAAAAEGPRAASARRSAGGGRRRVRRPLRPFWPAVLTGIYLGNVCSCQEMLRRHGRGQAWWWWTTRCRGGACVHDLLIRVLLIRAGDARDDDDDDDDDDMPVICGRGWL
jgi:hypothetical protein